MRKPWAGFMAWFYDNVRLCGCHSLMTASEVKGSSAGTERLTPSTAAGYFAAFAAMMLSLRIVSLWFNNSELFFDEAQYWVWAKEPAFGYFSKPPLLGWLIAAFTGLCGDSEFCVRLASPVAHTLTALFLYLSAGRLFGATVALLTGITWLTLPAVSLSSTLISTDVPLLFFWSLALYALVRFEQEDGWGWAILMGIAFGLGLNAKYAMAYFLLCAIVYSLTVSERPHLLRRGRFWIAIILGFAMLIPNILWNLENSFATVSHTGDNIGWGSGFPHFDRLGEFLVSQFGVFGPILFAVYLLALVRLGIEGASREQKLLIAFSLPVLLLISFQAIMSKAYANWAATTYPAATILLAQLLVTRVPALWTRVSLGLHGFVFAFLAVAVCFAGPGQLPVPNDRNPFERVWGGRHLADAASEILDGGGYTHILSNGRKRTAILIYYLRDRDESVLAWRDGYHPEDHFELTRAIQDMNPDIRKRAVFLLPNPGDTVSSRLAERFEVVELVGETESYPGSGKAISFHKLQGYRE
jgi:4-amino-4-deoxy-L-arabinose transferase-like glycosyltransferase